MTQTIQLDPLTKVNPGEYRPFGNIRDYWSCTARRVLVDGPYGTGKTRGVLEKHLWAALTFPKMRILWIRNTRESMTQTIMELFENEVIPASWGWAHGQRRSHRQSYINPETKAEIAIGGADKIDKYMSGQFTWMYWPEAHEARKEDVDRLDSRLRQQGTGCPYYQFTLDTNPATSSHWLKKDFEAGKLRRVKTVHSDNPFLPPGYVEHLKKQYTGHMLRRLVYGEWCAAEGQVYPHAVDCMVEPGTVYVPPRAELYGGIDFGYRDPFAAVTGAFWIAADGLPRAHFFHERYKPETDIETHARALAQLQDTIEREIEYFAGHDDPESRKKLKDRDLNVAIAPYKIHDGIEAVNRWMKSGRLTIASGNLGCPMLAEEADNLLYKDDESDMPTDRNNHTTDAIRYAIMGYEKRNPGLALWPETEAA